MIFNRKKQLTIAVLLAKSMEIEVTQKKRVSWKSKFYRRK